MKRILAMWLLCHQWLATINRNMSVSTIVVFLPFPLNKQIVAWILRTYAQLCSMFFCEHWKKRTLAYKSHFHICSYIVVKRNTIIYVDFPTSRQINIYNIPRYCKVLLFHEHSTNILFIHSLLFPVLHSVIWESSGKAHYFLHKLSHGFLHIPFHSDTLSNDASRPKFKASTHE